MKLIKCILIVQLSCLCRASQPSNQADRAHDQRGAEEEDSNSDPHVHHLSGRCSFTFRMPGNRSSGDVVALTADSTDMLVEQICQDLDCGSVYHVNKTSSPPNITCFNGCLYRDGRLQNCSQTVGGNCTVISEAVCGHQAARLAGGSDRCAGRVELWKNGRWGTVCDDQWDLPDADVVCAQLGCGYAISVTGQVGSFPPGRGPIHLDELNCTGKEDNLWACPAAQDESDCGHKEDAGVVCSEMRAIRLTGGLDRCSGKVEVHRNGSWGTVCDNCWTNELASKVCSMLQCGNQTEKITQFVPHLTHNNGTLWFYFCDQDVQNLWQCREYINSKYLCATSKASGVICKGSLGFPAKTTTASAADQTVTTSTTELPTPDGPSEGFSSLPIELLGAMALSLLLLVFLITNTVLCCHYRRRSVLLLEQTHSKTRLTSEHHHNTYQDSINLVKVTANEPPTDAPLSPRYFWTQLSSVDGTSVDTDYEQYEPSNESSVPLSTFRNSQRYKPDVNPLMKPLGLESLFEEGPESDNKVMGVFTGCNGGPTNAQYARASTVTVDSFDTSSTSSEETNEGYVRVTPELGPNQASSIKETLKLICHNDQHLSERQKHQQSSGDEEDDPLYSPVSPDPNSSSSDDYDDVDCLQ
ncbi:T-cell differentiation antigen CD6-like isoform X1 [Labrus bergylta]|uniref:T-cell differentiation antigen CD6-like isoform X1 n=1 Tax=Labrus bergylta TaxID=56723 RepID=UPI0033135BA6